MDGRLKMRQNHIQKEYDFEKMKGRKNPYASQLKQQITIKVETDIVFQKNLNYRD